MRGHGTPRGRRGRFVKKKGAKGTVARRVLVGLCGLSLWMAGSPLGAQPANRPTGAEIRPSMFVAGSYLDVIRGREQTPAVEIAVLSPPTRFPLGWMMGLMASGRGGIFAYAGVHRDLQIHRRGTIRPSFAAGLYEKGSGSPLGSVLEFRSALSLEWNLTSSASLTVFFYHLSNAGIGRLNPGLEALGIGLSLPVSP
jgi:hypothetical protein